MRVIDPDEPQTWPTAVMDFASGYAKRLRGSTQLTGDLDIPLDREDEFRSLRDEHSWVLAYHCTRLLDQEVAAIREQGLRMLSHELIDERRARAAGQEHAKHEGRRPMSSFADQTWESRAGQVCLVVGRRVFDDDPDGVVPLLSAWGGEGMYGSPLDPTVHPTIGRPAIVAARIDLSVSHRVSPTFPPLSQLFVGTLLETEMTWADVFLRIGRRPRRRARHLAARPPRI